MSLSTQLPLEPIEKASIDELRSLQLKRLKATLQHAYDNSPVYKLKFDAAGVHPNDCHTLVDLAKFPFTTKIDLRDSYPYGMFAVPRAACSRIHASSGTTGKPTVVGYTQRDIDTWATVVARSIRAGGAKPGDMVHVSYGYGLFTGGLGAHYGAEKLGLTVVPFGVWHAGSALLQPHILLIGLGVAAVSSAIPISLEMVALKRLTPAAFGVMASMEPAVAALMGVLVLHEHLTGLQWLAIALVMCAAAGSAATAKPEAHRGPADEIVQ